MRELVGNADQSCHLVVLREATVLVVLQVDSPLPMRYSVALGSHFPVLETSSGAVLLAALPPDEREALIRRRCVASGEAGASGPEIDARLAEIDQLGYEMRASLAVDGCINISVPVRDHIGATDRGAHRSLSAAEAGPLQTAKACWQRPRRRRSRSRARSARPSRPRGTGRYGRPDRNKKRPSAARQLRRIAEPGGKAT